MKFKFLKTVLVSTVLVVSSLANAGLIIDTSSGSGFDVFENFDSASIANHSSVTNQFASSGLNFSMATGNFIYNGCNGDYDGSNNTENALNTFRPTCSSGSDFLNWSIAFDDVVNHVTMHAGFANVTTSNAYLETLLNGQVVSTYTFTANDFWDNISPNHYHVSEVGFDELRFVSNENYKYAFIESIGYNRANSVPEPSTLAIFALGVIGLASRRFKK